MMLRMGHAATKAAVIHLHPVESGTNAIGHATARDVLYGGKGEGPAQGESLLSWALSSERVTGIEPALSAWEPYNGALQDRSRLEDEPTEWPGVTPTRLP